jgi:hypothetical protein
MNFLRRARAGVHRGEVDRPPDEGSKVSEERQEEVEIASPTESPLSGFQGREVEEPQEEPEEQLQLQERQYRPSMASSTEQLQKVCLENTFSEPEDDDGEEEGGEEMGEVELQVASGGGKVRHVEDKVHDRNGTFSPAISATSCCNFFRDE